MDITKLVDAIEKYKSDAPFVNEVLREARTPQQRAQADQMKENSREALESVFNECVDARVRAVLKELGLIPKKPNS